MAITTIRPPKTKRLPTPSTLLPSAVASEHALFAAPVGIFQTDPDGSCVFVNERWCEFAGLSFEAALGGGWQSAIHPDDRGRVLAEWQAAVAERRDFALEYRFQRPDGTIVWLAGTSTSLVDEAGEITGFVGSVTDINVAVAAREALNDERRFVDAVLDIAGSLVCVFDPEGRFLRFNRACERVSGWSFEEIRGRPFYEFLIPTEEIPAVRAALNRLRAGEPPASNINSWVTRDGALRLISWSNVSFFDERGSLTHIVSTGTDITEERRAQEALRGVEAVGTLLAKHGPTPEAMASVLQTLADGMGYPYLALFLRDDAGIHLGAQLGYGDIPTAFDPEAGIVGRVLRTGQAALVSDVSTDPDYIARSADVTSEIGVPLTADGRTIGVLSIESTLEAPLTADDLRLAHTIAERLSTALTLGREQQAIADRARLFASLTGFAEAANANLEGDQVIVALMSSITKVLPADVLGLVVLDRTTGRYIVRGVHGELDGAAVGTEIVIGEGATGRAIAARAMIVERVDRSRYAAGLRDLVASDTLWMAAVPLIRDGAILGSILLGRNTDREPAFSSLELEALSLMAAQTALALANAHLLEEVSELAIRDSLTGLYNRRHFDASLEHILRRRARDRRPSLPLSAIMFDLDHFGTFNKEHGHEAGDAVLRRFAGILLERFRSSDLVARYGGEEFVAILEGTTVADAFHVAEEVRMILADTTIVGPDGTQLRATVSAGCASLDDGESGREGLLRAADVGLFMAKRAGRNQVVAV